MYSLKHLKRLFIFILFNFTVAPIYADSLSNDFATIQANAGGSSWIIHPSVNYQSMQLKLSRNCSNATNCSSFDKVTVFNGQPFTGQLEDGGYYYELVVMPSLAPSVKAELQAMRDASPGKNKRSLMNALKSQGSIPERKVQSGYFTIFEGKLVSGVDVERKEKNYESIK